MKHIFEKGRNPSSPTWLLLHGTGGTEQDLLPLARHLDADAHVLGVRGNVRENGRARFFKRLREGVFDEEDLLYRTRELNAFLDEAADMYEFDRERVFAIGYSNGANIATSLLMHHERALCGAILFRPMVPRKDVAFPALQDRPVFIGAADNDPLVPPAETEELRARLQSAGARVSVRWFDTGHRLSEEDAIAAGAWLMELPR